MSSGVDRGESPGAADAAAARDRHPVRLIDRGIDLAPQSLDAVFTDPPYFGMVQYGELMHFCYVLATQAHGRRLPRPGAGRRRATLDELTGNETAERDIEHFAEGLAAVYTAHGGGAQARRSAGVHLPPQQAGGLSRRRDGHPRRGPDLFGLLAVPRRNGRLHPYSRNRLFHRRYRVCLPRPRRDAARVAVRGRDRACAD